MKKPKLLFDEQLTPEERLAEELLVFGSHEPRSLPYLDESRTLILEVIKQAIRDYLAFANSSSLLQQEYYNTARGFLFDDDYTVDWGDEQKSTQDLCDSVSLDLTWIRERMCDLQGAYEKKMKMRALKKKKSARSRQSNGRRTVYLAGAMESLIDAGLAWRQRLAQLLMPLGFDSVLPNVQEESIISQDELRCLKYTDLPKYIEFMRQFIAMDLKFVETLDIVIVNWHGEKTAGTIHEVGKAYELGKPCYLITSLPPQEIPGWFLACFTKVFATEDELLVYLGENNA